MGINEFNLKMLLLGLTFKTTTLIYKEITYSGTGIFFVITGYAKARFIQKIPTVVVVKTTKKQVACLSLEDIVEQVVIHFTEDNGNGTVV